MIKLIIKNKCHVQLKDEVFEIYLCCIDIDHLLYVYLCSHLMKHFTICYKKYIMKYQIKMEQTKDF